MIQPKTVEYGIHDVEKLEVVVGRIIKTSQWFSVTPYPDDYWVIKMKEDNESLLRTIVGAWGGGPVERGTDVEERSQAHEG